MAAAPSQTTPVLSYTVYWGVHAGALSAPQVLEQPLHDVHEAVGFGLDASQRVVVPRVPEQPAGQGGVSAVPAARSPAPRPYSPRGDTPSLQGTVILQPLLGGHAAVVLPQHQQHGREDLRGARLSAGAAGGCRGRDGDGAVPGQRSVWVTSAASPSTGLGPAGQPARRAAPSPSGTCGRQAGGHMQGRGRGEPGGAALTSRGCRWW